MSELLNIEETALFIQWILFIINILTIIYVNEKKLNYKVARYILCAVIAVLMVANMGELTWFSVAIGFAPLLLTIKIKDNVTY